MRHQGYEGNWSFDKYKEQCKDESCAGAGSAQADAGATGMALLCYLAAGQTHRTKGPYRANIERGLVWLVRHQEKDGNLGKNCVSPMYSHALAAIALCEAHDLSRDGNVGMAAQGAVNYIIAAQNKNDYGWRYNAGDPGDTSVTSWQITALKGAELAGLKTKGKKGSALELAGKWLDLVKTGPHDSQFQYQPGSGATPTMTAAGLLSRQHLAAKRDDPMMVNGVKYLMQNLPDAKLHNVYYWCYATQALHNYGGTEWDTWNRAMRKLLITTQIRDQTRCANGSWDPDQPAKDQWGSQGGRLMTTALACLTLEVYYRYLPLFKLDAEPAAKPAAEAAPEHPFGNGPASPAAGRTPLITGRPPDRRRITPLGTRRPKTMRPRRAPAPAPSVGSAPSRRRQPVEFRQLQIPVQGRKLYRRRRRQGRRRGHRPGPVVLPRRRPDPKDRGPLPQEHRKGPGLAGPPPGAGRQPRQGLHLAHVLARPGHRRLVRGLRQERRPRRGRRRAKGRELHRRGPKQERLWLAI